LRNYFNSKYINLYLRLGELFLETGENMDEILIHRGWARPYHRDKKKAWKLEELTASPFV
jgi:hypothetical protein